MQGIKDIFTYLERTHLINEILPEKSSFWMIGLSQLKTEITTSVKERLRQEVLYLIEKDRQDEKRTQRDLIAKLIHVMLALGFYKGYFEDYFLNQSKSFFEKESRDNLRSFNVQ